VRRVLDVDGLSPGPETSRIQTFLDGVGAGAGPEPPGGTPLPVPVGDDAAAFVPPAGEAVVVSSDASVEGIHFRREWMRWETVGYRAAAGALSDLAAMAAAPIGIVVSAALPPELADDTVIALGRGVGEALAVAGGTILGGDLSASPGAVFLDVTVFGHTPAPVLRSGAVPGDEVWVTGTLGGAADAVRDLVRQLEPSPASLRAFEHPTPRIAEAAWLAERVGVHAMIDLSDGLVRDGRHVARASGAALVIDVEAVPLPPQLEAIREAPAGRSLALAGGEDYELLLTAPAGAIQPLATEFEAGFGIPLTRIGRVEEGRGLHLEGAEELEALRGFDHFAGDGG
jgi:thiamine-monophosphate kinase